MQGIQCDVCARLNMLNTNPKTGFGYIYILSNPSMPNVYKVGLTTNSISKRIQELNTTGVPRAFKLEKLFEVPEKDLRRIERLAHQKLKKKDLHHGKEFFEGSIAECVRCVEDAIYEVTKIDAPELVGHAQKRAEKEEKARSLRAARLAEQLERFKKDSEKVDAQRKAYIQKLAEKHRKDKTTLTKYILEPLGLLIFLLVAISLMIAFGPIAWVAVPVASYIIYRKDKEWLTQRFESRAADEFPYPNWEDYSNENSNSRQNKIYPSDSLRNGSAGVGKEGAPGVFDTKPQGDTSHAPIRNRYQRDTSSSVKNQWLTDSSKSVLVDKAAGIAYTTQQNGLRYSAGERCYYFDDGSGARRISERLVLTDDNLVTHIRAEHK